MKLAFIGIGKVGFALAHRLKQAGHDIIIAHDRVESDSVLAAQAKNPNMVALPIQKAIDSADAIFLATPFALSEAILASLHFHEKLLIDCTNPVGPGIQHGLESKVSGAEKIRDWAGDAKVVKSFTIYGYENLENPHFPNYELRPAMLIAGDDEQSKAVVTLLNNDLGYDTVDTGGLVQALHLEHMTLLWVTMVRANGHHPNFTWGYLER